MHNLLHANGLALPDRRRSLCERKAPSNQMVSQKRGQLHSTQRLFQQRTSRLCV